MFLCNLPIIQNRRIRVAVVGAGRISQNHFNAIKVHEDDFELVSICEIDSQKHDELRVVHAVSLYADLGTMLKNESLDLIILCTPSGIHSKQAKMAASYGVNVVSEKPMATSLKHGREMVDACEKANVRLFIVKQNRLNGTLQLLKRAMDENRFGKIHLVHLNVFWTRPQSYYDAGGGWRGTWEFDGGALMNQASHYVDLLDWLIGPVEKVNAMMSTTRQIEAEDTSVMNIKWRNGALGSLAVTMLTYPKNLEGSITILGEDGSVKVGGLAVNNIEHWEFRNVSDYDKDVLRANYNLESVYGHGHPVYYKNIIDVFRGDCEPLTDGREGLKSLELLIAAYRSARDGVTKGLPLDI